MTEHEQKFINVENFHTICRVCLRFEENMIDIFTSGIGEELIELTNLRMQKNDELPQVLCRNCCLQIKQCRSFLDRAQESDHFLRTVLSNKAQLNNSQAKDVSNEKCLKNCDKKLGEKVETENKFFVIFVPEPQDSNEKCNAKICIQDLSFKNDNSYLSDYCKLLLKSQLLDHSNLKESENFSEASNSQNLNCDNLFDLEKADKEFYSVSFNVYECNECHVVFENVDSLNSHFVIHKQRQPSYTKLEFQCPVCNYTCDKKKNFMRHLKDHEKEKLFLKKIDSSGEFFLCRKNTSELSCNVNSVEDGKIFYVNLKSVSCPLCLQTMEPTDDISCHLESCFGFYKNDVSFKIKYLCPFCYEEHFDAKKFKNHLIIHRENNHFFVQIDSQGIPVNIEENDDLFLPYKEAVLLTCEGTSIFEIVNVYSCDRCYYSCENFKDLSNHYSDIHCLSTSFDISFTCPVCLEEYKDENKDEVLVKFYEHLMLHKNDRCHFILLHKNGELSAVKNKFSSLFTQSQVLLSLMKYRNFIFEYITPELVIDEKKSRAVYTCDICKKRYSKKQEIIEHLKTHQNQSIMDKTNYICEKCGKKFSGKFNYVKHFKRHSNFSSAIKRPRCKICNKIFANRATLNDHMKHHITEGEGKELYTLLGIICEKCGKSFSNNASLAKHKKKHLKEKENSLLKCGICNRDFFRQSSFERHKSAHLNPKYFECGVCKLPLSSVASLQKHSETHSNGGNTYDCRACNLSFLTKDSLTAHQAHTGHYLDREPFECNVCHEKFLVGKKFTEHIKTHPKYKTGECTLCGKRLSTVQSLMLHMGRHFQSNSILCPHCGKQFFEERNYHRHLLTHEGIKPYPCDTEGCKKSFYTLFELNRHMKYHNNTRNFRCSYCSKSFHEAHHLTVHVRTHTGERPYVCPHCNKGFVTRTHCKHHIKLMHQGVGYDLIRSNISKKVSVIESVETM